eukprot:EC096058.1.p2 GENE.EC096058.1~~EC096058.1.p2  ORF type:complete len:127 (-),score=2.42 EC096058.1:104-484(-)
MIIATLVYIYFNYFLKKFILITCAIQCTIAFMYNSQQIFLNLKLFKATKIIWGILFQIKFLPFQKFLGIAGFHFKQLYPQFNKILHLNHITIKDKQQIYKSSEFQVGTNTYYSKRLKNFKIWKYNI